MYVDATGIFLDENGIKQEFKMNCDSSELKIKLEKLNQISPDQLHHQNLVVERCNTSNSIQLQQQQQSIEVIFNLYIVF